MAYQPLRLDPACPARVQAFVRDTVESHFFADVRAMLRLPLPEMGITAGCNFAALEVLMAVVSGVSVTLFDAEAGAKTGNRGRLFRDALTCAYPWGSEPVPETGKALLGSDAADVIYYTFRNPLTHSLGKRDRRVVVKVNRATREGIGHAETVIEALESHAQFPAITKPPLPTVWKRPDATVIFVERFYWGVRKMIETLSTDGQRMTAAADVLTREQLTG
jgi:hypothetical protein